jgi:mono/diheme cytochrome c family protein
MRRLCAASWMWVVLSACDAGPDGALPAAYRDRAIPKELDPVRGRQLYLASCALCHGEHADGRGVRREGFTVRPADFTSPAWRERMSPRSVFFVIREGKPGTPMPAWPALGDDEVWDLAAYVLSVGATR